MLTQLSWDIMPFLVLTLSMTQSFVVVTWLYHRAKVQDLPTTQHVLARLDSVNSQYHILMEVG